MNCTNAINVVEIVVGVSPYIPLEDDDIYILKENSVECSDCSIQSD